VGKHWGGGESGGWRRGLNAGGAPLGKGNGGGDDRRGEVDSVGFVGFWPRRLPLQIGTREVGSVWLL
jgi:hypothetical protein